MVNKIDEVHNDHAANNNHPSFVDLHSRAFDELHEVTGWTCSTVSTSRAPTP